MMKVTIALILLCSVIFSGSALTQADAPQVESRPKCVDRMKALVTALFEYSKAHEKRLPKASSFQQEIERYLKNKDVLRCPEVDSGRASYSLNEKLDKLTAINRIPNGSSKLKKSQIVMIYEGRNKVLAFRHLERVSWVTRGETRHAFRQCAVVAFLDGHVECVSPQRAKKLHWG